jgi:probable F420-dependent oxidoreductase
MTDTRHAMTRRTGTRTLGRVGVWSMGLREHHDAGAVADAAAELEDLGYSSLFIPGRAGGDVLATARSLLEATERIAVVTGILNIWIHDATEVARRREEIETEHAGRFWLGLGVSHARLVGPQGFDRHSGPLGAMRAYLDGLDAADPPVPRRTRLLAALGPKMIELSRDRAGGAHPYLVPVEHTRRARAILGPGPLLAPEQPVLLESDPSRARRLARSYLSRYLESLPNYANNFLHLGFAPEELRDGGSERLVDAVVAWGDEERIAQRIEEHLHAGANHVCLQVITDSPAELPLESWRRLAPALEGLALP